MPCFYGLYPNIYTLWLMICCTSIKKPRFIVYSRGKSICLHMVVVSVVKWSGIFSVITLKVDVKMMVATNDNVTKLPIELAIWTIIVVVVSISLTPATRWTSSLIISKVIPIVKVIIFVMVLSIILVLAL